MSGLVGSHWDMLGHYPTAAPALVLQSSQAMSETITVDQTRWSFIWAGKGAQKHFCLRLTTKDKYSWNDWSIIWLDKKNNQQLLIISHFSNKKAKYSSLQMWGFAAFLCFISLQTAHFRNKAMWRCHLRTNCDGNLFLNYILIFWRLNDNHYIYNNIIIALKDHIEIHTSLYSNKIWCLCGRVSLNSLHFHTVWKYHCGHQALLLLQSRFRYWWVVMQCSLFKLVFT